MSSHGPAPAPQYWPIRLDRLLLACPRRVQVASIMLTLFVMAWQCVPQVPREFLDYSRWPVLRAFAQPAEFGTDTIADSYESKVILHDLRDMYTKTGLEQTPREAATWSKAASAPYPPAVLLVEAALYAAGQELGIGLYGMVLMLALIFVLSSAWYFLNTRWYVFPLLYLNFAYFAVRFVSVQDGSYLVMLVTLMGALMLARAGRPAAHAVVALAITMKLSPLYHVRQFPLMPRRVALVFAGILISGLIIPAFVWNNYTSIYFFHDAAKGSRGGLAAGLAFGAIFSVTLAYVETRLAFDLEDRIGWGLVPFAMFLAMKMNVPRHLLIVLLIPDKRAWRNVVAALALFVVLVPGVRFGATLPVATVLLAGVLLGFLRTIGWQTVADDCRNPIRTLRSLCRPASPPVQS